MSNGVEQTAAVDGTGSAQRQQLSFINVGGPTDARTVKARREVRAEAARRSADQRRATIAKRYGSQSAARKAGKEPNDKKAARRHSTATTDKRSIKQAGDPPASAYPTRKPSRSAASAKTCGGSLPTPPREPMMLELEPTTLDIASKKDSSAEIDPVSESIARTCSASAHPLLRIAITNSPDTMAWSTHLVPASCFPEQDAILPVTSTDDLLIDALSLDHSMITPPLESPCLSTPTMTMPNATAGLIDVPRPSAPSISPPGSTLPAGLASLRERQLLPEDLLFTVAQTVYVSPEPHAVWMLHGVASALFAPHMSRGQIFGEDELSAHIAMHVRLAAGLLVDMAAPGVVGFLQHSITEQQQHVGLLDPGTMIGTVFDQILLWSLVIIWAAKGRASTQQSETMQQLVLIEGVDSAHALTAVMERFVCPQWLRPAVQDLWHELKSSLMWDEGITARPNMVPGMTWMP
ncbi:hypothetical protein Tdes44962_MAKER00013 [Teratosphaeria destructans]|uniref:Uncharacterized protein n=1 Tax=Teratosphaeria destructans TaxID=418781 RepID=A0A9W7T2C0_9PEZI|nr:hypothetical protein Tdes44962_MAKER00013 [Teratosphaeria destructans]